MSAPTRGYRRVVRALRKGAQPGPEGFTWRGLRFEALPDGARLFGTEAIELEDGRGANWRVEQPLAEGGWHARLRIGTDRFSGVGKTAIDALESAAAEAANVATYIVAMLPPGGGLRSVAEGAAARRSGKARRASKRGAR